MGLGSFYADKLSPLLRKSMLGERIDMALIAFNANLQFARFLYAESGGRIYSDRELEEIFTGMDRESLEIAKRFMHRQFNAPANGLMIHPKYFYTEAEKAEYKQWRKGLKAAARQFSMPFNLVGPESLYYHHGLRFAPDFIKRNIKGKLFADIGGYLGDSALVFAGYSPEKIVIFEPDPGCRKILEKNLRQRCLREQCDVHPIALSDSNTKSVSMPFECRTLDDVRAGYTTQFGVLKADVEGMGLRFLKGARATIEQDRPLLSIAIYHNEEEFIGISQMLQEWKIDYVVELKSLRPMSPAGEVVLFAYPQEWQSC